MRRGTQRVGIHWNNSRANFLNWPKPNISVEFEICEYCQDMPKTTLQVVQRMNSQTNVELHPSRKT